MADVEAIEAELGQLKKRKLELTREIQREKDKKAKKGKSLATLLCELGADPMVDQPGFVLAAELLRHKDKNMLLAVFELSSHCSDTAVSWALGQGRSKSTLDQSSAETRQSAAAGVEWLYILSPQDLLDSLFETVHDKIYELGLYIVEYHLFHWLVAQNCSKGITPKARQVLAEAARSVPTTMPLADQDKLRKSFLDDTRLVRKWIESFRQRWGVKPGTLPAGDLLEPSVLKEKVAWILLALLFCMPTVSSLD